ncbi:unnamed protein product, partial [Mesorhabditis belari]|uniref:Protein SSUH2 homolog n=1 Tax=Mesorhabditis belari TaxID=2138241 RepID=A0AAF3EZ43_9BILA
MSRVISKTSESYNLLQPPQDDIDRHKKATSGSSSKQYFDDIIPIGESEVREVLLREAKRHRYWKKSTVKKMQIEGLEASICLKYNLESYTEARSTVETTEAYVPGATIDAAFEISDLDLGPAHTPNPWDFEVFPATVFVDQVRVQEIPGTSRIIKCVTCSSDGTIHCFSCRGSGSDKCRYCRGTGMKSGVVHPAVAMHPLIATIPHADTSRGFASTSTAMMGHRGPNGVGGTYGLGTPMHFISKTGVPPPGIGRHDLCFVCHGAGVGECSQCRGSGKKPCSKCGGSGSIRSFSKMKIFFKTEATEYYTESPIPEKYLRDVNGKEIFCDEQPYVLPITRYPMNEINEASKRICAEHLQRCLGNCRVIKQRHSLLAIPVAQVRYSIGKEVGLFYVFGRERECYVPKTSSKCTIL